MNKFSKNQKTILIIFSVLISIVCLVYIYRANRTYSIWIANRDACQNTGGKFESNKCRCSRVFPILNAKNGRCQDVSGFSPASFVEANTYIKRYNFNSKCSIELSGEVYVIPGTPATLCYSNSIWGEPAVKEIKSQDNKIIYQLSFYRKNILNLNAPKIWYFLHATDIITIKELSVGICFDCVDMSKEIDIIKRAIDKDDEVDKIQRFSIDDRSGLYIKMKRSTQDYYYIPSVFGQHDMVIVLPSQVTASNNFVNNFWFDRFIQ